MGTTGSGQETRGHKRCPKVSCHGTRAKRQTSCGPTPWPIRARGLLPNRSLVTLWVGRSALASFFW
jgi:hypothetical protein